MSVAKTVAPSLANARAVAAPMPWPAAVRSAFFPFSLPLNYILRFCGGCRNRSEDRPLQRLGKCRSWKRILWRDFETVGIFAGL